MKPFQLPKIKTGIKGLDEILAGGLPLKRTSIVSGGPGCGKTVMGLQFIYHGAKNNEPGIYIIFEEKKSALRQNALTLGWDLAALEEEGKIILLDNPLAAEVIRTGEINLDGLRAAIAAAAKKINACRIVVDALDVLFYLLNDTDRERQEVIQLQKTMDFCGLSSLITTKTKDENAFYSYGFMDSMVDCVIHLDQRVVNQVTTRRLRVKKYRGSGFGKNEYPYTIDVRGVHIIPVSTLDLRHKPLGEYVSSGQTDLDEVLGGGYRRASSVLIAGVTGTGKTSLAATFSRGICSREERLLYISFEESREAMMNNMLSPGIDLKPAMENGFFKYMSGLPESMGAEEHLVRAFKNITAFKPAHLVIDAISACRRMGTEKAAFDYLVRLLNLSKERGITCILLNQTIGPSTIQELSGIEISSIIDTVLSLHMTEETGEINRTMVCLKSRGSRHSNQYREYQITDNGICLMPVYIGDGRVLTGTARKILEEKEANQALKIELEIEEKERELEKLRQTRKNLKHNRMARATMRGGLKNDT